MDIEDLLPFLFIIGSLIFSFFRKKKGAENTTGDEAPRPNIFEELMEELGGGNQKSQVDDDFEYELENVQQEPVVAASTNIATEPTTDFSKYSSINAEGVSSIKRREFSTAEVLHPEDESASSLEFNLADENEQRKALIYSEILKPIYF